RVGRDLRIEQDDGAELSPLALVLYADVDLLAVAGEERPVRGDGRMFGAAALRWRTAVSRVISSRQYPLAERIEQRNPNDPAASCSFAPIERHENAAEGVHSGGNIRRR